MADPAYKSIMYVATYNDLPINADTGQLCMDMATSSTYQWNGSAWLPLGRVVIKKEATNVNAKNTGSMLLYTLEPSPLNFYPFAVVPRATGAGVSGVVTGPTISIGSNPTSYNNIASSSLLGNVIAALTGGNSLATSTNSPALPGGTNIYANITVGAIATNYTLKYDILGYYDA